MNDSAAQRTPVPIQAHVVPSSFLLHEVQMVDGSPILCGGCASYEQYVGLPKVLQWEGNLYALTGWNSDVDLAYWKPSRLIASVL